MHQAILQVPMSKNLKREAKSVALDYGFSSLQEAVRVILNKLANRQLTLTIEKTVITLSPKAESEACQALKDHRRGKTIELKSMNDLDNL